LVAELRVGILECKRKGAGVEENCILLWWGADSYYGSMGCGIADSDDGYKHCLVREG
jgi:hypothetical protein